MLPVAISVLGVAKHTKKLEAVFGGITKTFGNLLCKVQPSCRGPLLSACKAVGYAGYMYRNSQGQENYYWKSGEAFSTWADADLFFVASGYREKLKNMGVSECCLKHFPSEALENRGAPKTSTPTIVAIPGWPTIYFDGAISQAEATAKVLAEIAEAKLAGKETPDTTGFTSAGFNLFNPWVIAIGAVVAIAAYVYTNK